MKVFVQLTFAILFLPEIANAQYGTVMTNLNSGDIGNNYGDGATSGAPSTCVIQNDNKIVIGTSSSLRYNGVNKKNVLRIKPDGTLDSTFGTFDAGSSGSVNCLAVQNDGKILVGGYLNPVSGVSAFPLVRLFADGSLDASFRPVLPGFVNAISIDPDGKVVATGHVQNSSNCFIARFLTDGTADPSFQANNAIPNGPNNVRVERFSDGTYLVNAGIRRLMRLTATGQNDPSFLSDVTLPWVNGFKILSNGKIVCFGYESIADGTYRIIGVNNNGSIDGSYVSTVFKGEPEDVSLSPGDAVLLLGYKLTINNSPPTTIIKFNANGTRDNSHQVSLQRGPVMDALATANGKVIAIGLFGENYKGKICRLNNDGTQDQTFNSGTGINGEIYHISEQSDGKKLVAGIVMGYNGMLSSSIFRINGDGSKDLSFNPGFTDYRGILSTAILPSGKILIGGILNPATIQPGDISQPRLLRINNDGTIDNSFTVDTSPTGYFIYAVVVQPDRKILIGGDFNSYLGVTRKSIARLNADGTIDASFNAGTGLSLVETIALQPDGKMVIGGPFTNINGTPINRIARLNADGSLDASFAVGAGFNGEVWQIRRTTAGKFLVCGAFTSYNGTPVGRIIRLNADGTPDAGFTTGSGANNLIECMALRSDGMIAAGGDFTIFNGTNAQRLVLLNPDGSLNVSFGTANGANSFVEALHFESDGNLLAAGAFTSYAGIGRNRLVRLLAPPVVTAVSNMREAGELSLSPIPAPIFLDVRVEQLNTRFALRVLDINGRVVHSSGVFMNSCRIDLTHLPAAHYLVEITNLRTGQKSTRGFVH